MPPGHVLCENILFAPLIIDEKPIGLLGLANKPALSALYEPLITPSSGFGEIAATVLEKAKQLTKSEHGYVSSIDPVTGNADVHNFSAMMEEGCRITPEKTIAFTKNEDGHYGGLCGNALNTLEPFYTNEPQNHPASEGLPEGHLPIQRFLGVPVKLGQKLVGQIALVNKTGDYTDLDLEAIGRVADFYALAIQKHLTDEALQKAKEELEMRVEERIRSWVDLAILADKVLSICQNKIRKSVKSLIKDVPEGLPRIFSDPYTLEQVLINLLLNAAQAADKPDSWVKLTVAVNDKWKDHAIIQVSDNGCGIDDQNRLKIFDPFFTTKPSLEGTGLGLYVCHNLVEGLGGRIEVERKTGEGSTFTVILPDKERRQKPRV